MPIPSGEFPTSRSFDRSLPQDAPVAVAVHSQGTEGSGPDGGPPRSGGPTGQTGPNGSPPTRRPPTPRDEQGPGGAGALLTIILILVGGALIVFMQFGSGSTKQVAYSFFRDQLNQNNVKQVLFRPHLIEGTWRKPPEDPTPLEKGETAKKPLPERFTTVLPPVEDLELMKRLLSETLPGGERIEVVSDRSDWIGGANLLFSVLIFVLFGLSLWFMVRRSSDPMGTGGIVGNFVRSPAKLFRPSDQTTTFADVAGMEQAKRELQEIVEFLKNPAKFQKLGAHIPKGVLLMGPPGTGKTLVARATAGEAGVPFFSINGSEFIQMFVGVGASRVRDMFATAKAQAPCILFVDEIDAVGRVRGAGVGGGHDEREQTLNQILSEMDGFQQGEAVIVLAATNRPDVLDPALLRPGRFDRHVTVDRPTRTGRLAVLKVHTRKVPLAEDVDLDRVAGGTIGFAGADLKNLVNEAALEAARRDASKVAMADFDQARDRVLMGVAREEVMNEHERRMTAFHEAGHALLAWVLPEVDPVHKVTIIPRGRALGVTQLIPSEERYSYGESRLKQQLVMTMGGRAAEKLRFDEYTAGPRGT